ncbi:MAG: polysaccharide biosynthesis protein, partial [Thermodesulfobacteriota bacterium]|nr:polysaccharide biosynthesis protein [Thermodesulfobacteriota bacterium]
MAAYFLAYLLRFEGEISSGEWMNFKNTVPYFLALKLIIFMALGLYGGMWRYTSLVDLLNALKGTLTSSTLIILAILFIYRFQGFPRSVFIIDGFLTFIFIGGLRVTIRLFLSEGERGLVSLRQILRFGSQMKPKKLRKRLLIIG